MCACIPNKETILLRLSSSKKRTMRWTLTIKIMITKYRQVCYICFHLIMSTCNICIQPLSIPLYYILNWLIVNTHLVIINILHIEYNSMYLFRNNGVNIKIIKYKESEQLDMFHWRLKLRFKHHYHYDLIFLTNEKYMLHMTSMYGMVW